MKTIEHKFINDLIQLEKEQTFSGRSIIGKNKLLVVGTFNPEDRMICKKNEAEWFYGRNANNLWKYIPEAMINSSLKGLKKEDWIKFCKKNEVVIIDLVKTFNSNQKLNSFSDEEVESLISKKESNTTYFNSKEAFRNCNFDFVVFTRKNWENTIPTLLKAKESLINNLLELKTIKSIEKQIIYCPAPWGNFTKRAEEWSNKMQVIKNK